MAVHGVIYRLWLTAFWITYRVMLPGFTTYDSGGQSALAKKYPIKKTFFILFSLVLFMKEVMAKTIYNLLEGFFKNLFNVILTFYANISLADYLSVIGNISQTTYINLMDLKAIGYTPNSLFCSISPCFLQKFILFR